jgi:hypothetical protein
MSLSALQSLIDLVLPDDKVLNTMRTLLLSESKEGIVSIEIEESVVEVPVDCELSIITKSYIKGYNDEVFGVLRSVIALGTIQRKKNGIVDVQYCFCRLYFDNKLEMISQDFYRTTL